MLRQKLFRDVWGLRTQILAITAVLACGIGTFVMSTSTVSSLERTRSEYYWQQRFGDVFCDVKRAPESMASQLANIPGVQYCETRVSTFVRLQLDDMKEPASAQLLSLHYDFGSGLNRVHLRQGRLPAADSIDEVVVSEAFASAHQLQLGHSILAVIAGRQEWLRIVGIGLSPEFIYEIAPAGLLPDSRSFGVFWMNREGLASAIGMTGAFNQLSLDVSDQAHLPKVLGQLDRMLEPYGSTGAYSRKDQRSHRFLSSEMDELRGMGIVAPLLFLGVASFLMNMVLSRLISTQREQIAALKAFGFTRWEIARHYLGMAIIISSLGAIVGSILGSYLGNQLTSLYSRFFHFPVFEFSIPWYVLLFAWTIGWLSGLLGVWSSVRQVMKLQPAEAMRPEPPQSYRAEWLEAMVNWLILGPAIRMVLRHLYRKPRRAILSVLGISLSVAVLILGSFMEDAIYSMFDTLFRLSRRYELQVSFREPVHESVIHELQSIDGILACELFRSVPVRLRHEARSRLLAAQGVVPNSVLSPLIDRHQNTVDLPVSGALISRKLAEVVGLDVGDPFEIEVLEGKRGRIELTVVRLIDDVAGENLYLARDSLQRLLREEPQANGAYLAIDPNSESEVLGRLHQRPNIAAIAVTRNLKQSFLSTIGENVRRMRRINLLFSMIIAIGVIYSTAKISLAERSRDLATLRVLGYSHREIRFILLGELGTLTLLAIPIGWLEGYLLAFMTMNAFDRELFRIPLVVRPDTYWFASLVVIVSMWIAAWIVQGQLRKLSIVEVLKTRE